MHGNKFLRVIPVQCAWVNMRSKNPQLGYKYALLVKRIASPKNYGGYCQKIIGNYLECIKI